MTREEEGVLDAARTFAKRYPDKLAEELWSGSARPIVVAIRALEESEKPKPKVWVVESGQVRTKDDEFRISVSSVRGWDQQPTRELVCRALNLLEQTECKPCFEYRCNKCLREAGPCCTCKST